MLSEVYTITEPVVMAPSNRHNILLIDFSGRLSEKAQSQIKKTFEKNTWQVRQERDTQTILTGRLPFLPACILMVLPCSEPIEKIIENIQLHYFPQPVPIVMIGSAQEDTLQIVKALKAGAHSYLDINFLSQEIWAVQIEQAMTQCQQLESTQHSQQTLLENYQELEQRKLLIENELIDRMAELQEVYEQLVQEINARKQIEQGLIDARSEMDSFVYRASHDLRGPIASLIGLTNLAKVDVTDQNALRYFNMMAENAAKLNKILMTLLEITEVKYTDLKLEPIDFTDLATKIKHAFLKDFLREGIEFKVNVESEQNLKFFADKKLLRTILHNLIENSVQFSKKEQQSWIHLHIVHHQQSLKITVTDNGQGIDKSVQAKVFSLFFKHHPLAKGAGVGLYVVKNCIERLKGKMQLVSELGTGTEFTLFLPNLEEL